MRFIPTPGSRLPTSSPVQQFFLKPDFPRLLYLTNSDHPRPHPPPHTPESRTDPRAQIPIRTNLRLRVQIRNPLFHDARPPLGHHLRRTAPVRSPRSIRELPRMAGLRL